VNPKQGAFGQDAFGKDAFGMSLGQAKQQQTLQDPANLFGQGPTDPFGQAFGMPSTVEQGMFGGQAQGVQQGAQQGLFGAPSNPGQQGLFGAPSNPAQQGLFGAPSNPAQQGFFGAPSKPAQQGLFGGQGMVQQPLGTKDPESATFPELFEAKDTIYACTSDENRVVYVGDASGNLYAKSAQDFASTPMENKVPQHSDKDCIGVTSLKSLGQGKVLIATAAKLAFIWDVNQNRMLGLGETGQALARHASPSLVFAGSWDKTVKCRDLRAPKDAWVLTLPGKCHALDVLQDQRLYVAANTPSDSVVCVYDARKPSQPLLKVKCASPVRTLCVSQSRAFWGTDGGDLTQTGHSGASTYKTQLIQSPHSTRAVINQVDWSPNGEKVFVGTTQGKLFTVDTTFKIRNPKTFASSAPLTAISASSDIVVCKSYNYYDGGQAMRQGTAYKHNQVLVLRKPS
jgi:WD40 repeat protein